MTHACSSAEPHATAPVIPGTHLRSRRRVAGREVLLVDLYWTRDKDPRVPLGHASLLAALAHAGVTAHSLARPVQECGDLGALVGEIADRCAHRDPASLDLALGAYVWNEERLAALLPALRARGLTNRIILGGPQITYAGPGLEALYPDADVFVRGAGERALVELAVRPGRPPVEGVHHAGDLDRQEQTSPELHELPSPWLTGIVPLAGQRFVRWETQRGCPYRCSFCQHRDADGDVRHRPFSLARIEAEIDLFCATGVEEIAVLDPIFNLAGHAIAVLERFAARGFRGRLALQCRAERLDRRFLDAAGAIDVCLELGLQTIHAAESKAVGRGNQLARVDVALAELRERGLDHEVSLIFGLPEQTLASFLESVRWCLDRRVPTIKAFPLLLLRGTELERTRDRWGYRDDGRAAAMAQSATTFSLDDWHRMNRVSRALQHTEGRHPGTLDELLRLAADLPSDDVRWQPPATEAS